MNKIIFLLTALLMFSCKQEQKPVEKDLEAPNPVSSKPKIIDLTHEFSEETVYWVTAKEFEMDVVAEGHTDAGYYYAANNFATAEHGGTHIDAPIHFAANKQHVNEIPLEKLIGPAIKVDVSERSFTNPDYLVSIEDFTNWEKEHGMQIPEGSIVLLETGFSKYYPDKKKYLGTDQRGPEAVKLLHFPGLDPEAAQWLVDNRKINSIGLDTPSIDYGQSKDFKAHVILLSENIPAFENLTNLEQLPTKDFEVVALPMKIKGGSGAPLRIVAFVNE
ncbi:cyclase family protein [Seonamhaeicola sp.]|uniref:cyclase family protein n=1 Tax=Seonamhaeicola sp. TaxID=1912245 RepID=UPI0026306698|nr:cyclase family protein [Seonamhaeicola sp.]